MIRYDEIEGIRWKKGYKDQFIIDIAGEKPFTVKGIGAETAAAIVSGIDEMLHPALIEQDKALPPNEINRIIGVLSEKCGVRPGVLFKFLMDQALFHRATDVHLGHSADRYRARFRIDGILHDIAVIPELIKQRMIAYIKNAAGLASYRRDVPQEGRLTHQSERHEAIGVRLSIVPAYGEESIVLRLFSALRGSLELDCLGFSPTIRAEYERLLETSGGLILISGPSNSGKTTTIYASLQYLMKGPRLGQRAISLEDPIEFPLSSVTQIAIDPRRNLTFDRLLSTVIRQDVEVITVGEIRDGDTAAIALRSALTGHLILSTVHCGRAAEAPRRLTDLGLSAPDVAEALAGVLVQRLIRPVCPQCGQKQPITHEMQRYFEVSECPEFELIGQGCDHCLGTGYFGRTVIAELIRMSDGLKELIRNISPTAVIRDAANQLGMSDIKQDALQKIVIGQTNFKEIRRVLK